eukprot:GGOE01011558.1.p1 GENE.GGOE01011558.1~~GGOE01011558.1.p1  ORF type:complete len:304 (+),score=95.76 GGOE01011558.1:39-950(+)
MTYSPDVVAVEAAEPESPSVISPRLLLGCENDAVNTELLRRFEVTHILNVSDEVREVKSSSIRFKRICIQDRPHEPLHTTFQEASRFISEGLAKGVVLVHCHAGVSRSSTIIIAHLMLSGRLSLREAYTRVKQARPIIEPNTGFLNQLRHLEVRIHGAVLTNERLTPNDLGKRFHMTWADDLNEAVDRVLEDPAEFPMVVDKAYAALADMDVAEQEAVVRQAMQKHFERHSSKHAADGRAREVFASILVAASKKGKGAREGIQLAMDLFGQTDAMNEFAIDVPLAPKYFAELSSALVGPTADP